MSGLENIGRGKSYARCCCSWRWWWCWWEKERVGFIIISWPATRNATEWPVDKTIDSHVVSAIQSVPGDFQDTVSHTDRQTDGQTDRQQKTCWVHYFRFVRHPVRCRILHIQLIFNHWQQEKQTKQTYRKAIFLLSIGISPQLLSNYCPLYWMPIAIWSIETLPLYNDQLKSLDFVINRFLYSFYFTKHW